MERERGGLMIHNNYIVNKNKNINLSLFPYLSLSPSLSPCQKIRKTDENIEKNIHGNIEQNIYDDLYTNLKNYFYNELDKKEAHIFTNEFDFDEKLFRCFEDAIVQKSDEDYWYFLREFLLNKEERERLMRYD
jgi:hypothetical protein